MKLTSADILRIIMIIAGVYMLCKTVASLAKRKMHDSFCLVWGVVSVSIILAGIILRPDHINEYISITGLILVLIIFFCGLYAAFFVSVRISELMRKNQELAIQVSLLNQENEVLIKDIQSLKKEKAQE